TRREQAEALRLRREPRLAGLGGGLHRAGRPAWQGRRRAVGGPAELQPAVGAVRRAPRPRLAGGAAGLRRRSGGPLRRRRLRPGRAGPGVAGPAHRLPAARLRPDRLVVARSDLLPAGLAVRAARRGRVLADALGAVRHLLAGHRRPHQRPGRQRRSRPPLRQPGHRRLGRHRPTGGLDAGTGRTGALPAGVGRGFRAGHQVSRTARATAAALASLAPPLWNNRIAPALGLGPRGRTLAHLGFAAAYALATRARPNWRSARG